MKFQTQVVCTLTIILFCAIAIDSSTPTTTQKPTVDVKATTNKHGGQTKTETLHKTTSKTIISSHNNTGPMLNGTLPDSWYGQNRGMLMRTVYVVLGVTAIVVIYFGVRAWRMRRSRSKSRKYGLISTGDRDLEMEPLENDIGSDDDMTVFEQNGRRK